MWYVNNIYIHITSDICDFRPPNVIGLTSSLFLFDDKAAMCSVYSAVSGERLVLLEDVEGKSAREIKLVLAARRLVYPGFGRDSWRMALAGPFRTPDDEILTSDRGKIQLMLVEFQEPDAVEDQRMMDASTDNDLGRGPKFGDHLRTPLCIFLPGWWWTGW